MFRQVLTVLLFMFVGILSVDAHRIFPNGDIDCSENGQYEYVRVITLSDRTTSTLRYTVNHFTPNTGSDPCKTNNCSGIDTSQYQGGHGHKTSNNDWGYWSKAGYEFLCGEPDEEPVDDTPAVTVSVSADSTTLKPGESTTIRATISNLGIGTVEWTTSGGTLTGSGDTRTFEAPTGLTTTTRYTVTVSAVIGNIVSATDSVTITVTVEETDEIDPPKIKPPIGDNNNVDGNVTNPIDLDINQHREEPEKPIEDIVDEEIIEEPEPEYIAWEYGYWLPGVNFVSFPAMKPEIETIADLFAYYSFFEVGVDEIWVLLDGVFHGYNGGEDQVAGDVPIVPYLGVAIVLDRISLLRMPGAVRLIGDGSVDINAGMNLIGLTELPSRFEYPSDLLSVDGVEIVIITHNDPTRPIDSKRYYIIGKKGDAGDELPLYLGQGVLIISSIDTTLDLTEQTPSAPSALRRATMTWGAIKNNN